RFGGGLFNLGEATVRDSTFTGNTAGLTGGGLGNLGTATVSGSTFAGNTAGSGNGGLNNEPGGLLTQFDNRFLDDQPSKGLPSPTRRPASPRDGGPGDDPPSRD